MTPDTARKERLSPHPAANFIRATPLVNATENARKIRALLSNKAAYAACLCIAPDAEAWPRIALTERSIAAHSRPISDAARPSA